MKLSEGKIAAVTRVLYEEEEMLINHSKASKISRVFRLYCRRAARAFTTVK
jgi:hypothetical protein